MRELRNVIERIVLMSPNSGPITSEEVLQVLPRAASASSPDDRSHLPLDEIERLHIQLVLEEIILNQLLPAQGESVDITVLVDYSEEDGSIEIILTYAGKPCNPFEEGSGPDDLSIRIIRKLVTQNDYSLQDGKNLLRLVL